MNMPDIKDIESTNQAWFKPEDVIPSIIAEIGELNDSEIKRLVDELKRPYFLSPKVLTLEHDDIYTMAYRDYITLQGHDLEELINFLTKAHNSKKEVAIGSVTTHDEYGDSMYSFVVVEKQNIDDEIKESFVKRIKRDILSHRKYLQEREEQNEKNRAIDEKMADLIAKFQSKQIEFDEFKKESDLLDKERKAVYS